jgi:hypothetical protein
MSDRYIRASAPFRLMRAAVRCWKCGERMPVVGLTAATVEQGGESHGNPKAAPPQPVLLHHIADMPYDLIQVVRAYQPRFVKRDARIGDAACYQNECHGCGTGVNDDELFSQPGGPFFSSPPDPAAPVEIYDLPVIGTLELQADWTEVGGDFVFAGERT